MIDSARIFAYVGFSRNFYIYRCPDGYWFYNGG